ncbi:acetyl esterase [Xylaria bambusicola]|uniref:acetyl esterase n=1 Tax=Xylaria bambusicola TaxID=326684 RepID=UPI0020088C4A|nr:acetyl esterase [Xylaria bambusicola]KAI0521641.1 acetyl esterase [Xylaria bambusicola]
MPLTSDVTINFSRFDPKNTPEEAKQYSDFLEKTTTSVPRWFEIGAPKFRELIEEGGFGGLKPVTLPEAQEFEVPSREPGRTIPIRMYKPDNGKPTKGIMLHIHGGGYCLGSHRHVDGLLKFYANTAQLTALSIGYRLAPEHPYPAGLEDCIDATSHLLSNPSLHGPLLFMAGESGGSHFAVLTTFHLLRSHPDFSLKGLILPYGNYSITMSTPSLVTYTKPVLVDRDIITHFRDAYTPGWTQAERQNPRASPMFDDLQALASASADGKLPPALFLCGTNDPMLDDTLLMGLKWQATGSEAIIKIFPGAPHVFNVPTLEIGKEAFGYEAEFLLSKM